MPSFGCSLAECMSNIAHSLEDEMKALRAENDALSRDIKSLMVNSGGVMRVQDHEKKRREVRVFSSFLCNLLSRFDLPPLG